MEKVDRKNAQIYLRDLDEADVSFIFNSWLKSFRGGQLCKYVDNNIYFNEHHKLVEKLLKRCSIKVACSPDNPADIYGYIASEVIDGIFCLHYCYVKHTFRNLGIFRTLLASTPHNRDVAGIYTHSTMPCASLGPKLNLIYHPYILLNYMDTAPSKSSTTEPA